MAKNNKLFRKSALDRISKPEELNEYIKISSMNVWILLSAIIVFLLGLCAWGVLGTLESSLSAVVISENGTSICYLPTTDTNITQGMEIKTDDLTGKVTSTPSSPIIVDHSFNQYAIHVGTFQEGDWVLSLSTDLSLPDGVYKAKIITERINPIKFLIN